MLNIVLFGAPGAGKGTQSKLLIDKYQLSHISTGDIFRYNIKNETDLGVLANNYIEKGELVPDEVTIGMVKDFLESNPNENGYIFDGFPRTIAQGEALDTLLENWNTEVKLMVALEVEEDECVRRLLERGKTSGRKDDQDEATIRNRFEVYRSETSPLAEFYSNKHKYVEIHGEGGIEDIFNRIVAAIEMKR